MKFEVIKEGFMSVRDCNVYVFDVVRDVCLFCNALCLEGFSLFKQANKLFFADQDI